MKSFLNKVWLKLKLPFKKLWPKLKLFFKRLWLKATQFYRKPLNIQLSVVIIIVVIASIAFIRKAIDLPTIISIFALSIAICIFLTSTHEIRNRLRPWVAVHKIQINKTAVLDSVIFRIKNTGNIPATRMLYTAMWFLKENNDKWRQDEGLENYTLKGTRNTLFPNQEIWHEAQMYMIKMVAKNRDIKVTFKIEYKGLWSKHTTTNTFKHSYSHGAWASDWVPDEPQDYT